MKKNIQSTIQMVKPIPVLLIMEIELSSGQPKFYILKCSNEGTASGEAESQLHSHVISRFQRRGLLKSCRSICQNGDYSHAQADLNIIRERSLPGRGYNDLNASNAKRCE
ncbi:hypothetical protein NXW91_23765 [Bacteroides fragilis]|nr:hypothetical protein [Bacteroides fragilis]